MFQERPDFYTNVMDLMLTNVKEMYLRCVAYSISWGEYSSLYGTCFEIPVKKAYYLQAIQMIEEKVLLPNINNDNTSKLAC